MKNTVASIVIAVIASATAAHAGHSTSQFPNANSAARGMVYGLYYYGGSRLPYCGSACGRRAGDFGVRAYDWAQDRSNNAAGRIQNFGRSYIWNR